MSTFSGDTSPIPSFQRVLSACYCAEIDVQMQMIWDCGIRVAVAIRSAEGIKARGTLNTNGESNV